MDYGLILLGGSKIIGALIFVIVIFIKATKGKDAKLPKFVYVLGAVFAMTIGLSIYFSNQKNLSKKDVLVETAKKINSQFSTPAKIEDGVILNNVSAKGETLQYFMTFTELELGSLDKTWFQSVVNGIKNGACNNPDARLLKEGFSLEYHYSDKNGEIIQILSIKPNDCISS